LLDEASQRWPRAGHLTEAWARLLHDSGEDPARACQLVRHAVQNSAWTPALLLLSIDIHLACNRRETAARLATAAAARFPASEPLRARLADLDP
jgi:predicted Zn-dependent protease